MKEFKQLLYIGIVYLGFYPVFDQAGTLEIRAELSGFLLVGIMCSIVAAGYISWELGRKLVRIAFFIHDTRLWRHFWPWRKATSK